MKLFSFNEQQLTSNNTIPQLDTISSWSHIFVKPGISWTPVLMLYWIDDRTSHWWLHIFFINQQKKIPQQQQGSWQMRYCESVVGNNLRMFIIYYLNRSLPAHHPWSLYAAGDFIEVREWRGWYNQTTPDILSIHNYAKCSWKALK